jgi:hypothetical protein
MAKVRINIGIDLDLIENKNREQRGVVSVAPLKSF